MKMTLARFLTALSCTVLVLFLAHILLADASDPAGGYLMQQVNAVLVLAIFTANANGFWWGDK